LKNAQNQKSNIKLPELLSPCGSPEALDAAVRAGADAVYLGGPAFNARINAHNFSDDELRAAVSKCHDAGVRLYVTFNTMIYDREFSDALKYAEFLYKIGVDALILADVGLSAQIKKYFPDFELHASTQLSGHNSEAAKFLYKHGFSRMVCARELSRENIEKLISDSPIEIEMFVHGAMCVSHSGQCLMSSVIGGRSGNRGLCAQPCRMKYNDKYMLSLKDMCLAAHVTEIIDSGASSLKIEGRMKSPDYVYGVTKTYRKLLDENRNASEAELKHMAELFSRGGFSDGYFTGNIGRHMLGIRSDEDKEATKKVIQKSEKRNTEKAPDLSKRLPIPEYTRLNSLPEDIVSYKNIGVKQTAGRKSRTARFADSFQIPRSVSEYFDIIYLPLEKISEDRNNAANGAILPPVVTDAEIPRVKKQICEAGKKGIKHLLIGNTGHLSLVENPEEFILHGDYRLNICNSFTAEFFGQFFEDMIISPELTFPQIRDIKAAKSVICYGRLPLMLCEKHIGAPFLSDRTGMKFPVVREAGRDVVLNGVDIYMADKKKLFEQSGVFSTHYIFSVETSAQVDTVIKAYKNSEPPKTQNIKRIKA